MNNYFTWKGEKCTQYGIYALELPPFTRPAERVDTEEVPGRSGELHLTQGDYVFDSMDLSCTCMIKDDSNLTEVCAYLSGSGDVIFANRAEGYYKARIINQIPFEKILRGNAHRSFDVEFRCQPFFFLTSGETTLTFSESATTITNEGNISSRPLIRIVKATDAEEGTLMIGDQTMMVTDFSDIDEIYLDCDAMIVYATTDDGYTLLNSRITGEWLEIPTGTSYVTFTDGIASVEITPRWRCI